MNIYIPIGLFFSFVCYLLRQNQRNAELFFTISIILVWALMSIRYEFGPDYFNYWQIYYGIQGEDLDNYTGKGQSVEISFLRFLKLFPNYTSFVVFLTTFWFGANLFFIKKYIESKYYWLVILYMFFNANYLLSSLVAMRTTLCACLFLVALNFLINGKRVLYVGIIVLASLIHSSTIFLILFAFLTKKNNSLFFNFGFAVVFGLISLFSFVAGENLIMNYFSGFLIDNIDSLQHYSNYKTTGANQSFNTFLFRVMSMCILLYLIAAGRQENNDDYIIMYKIGIVEPLLLLVLGQNMIADRFSLILNPIFIIVFIRSVKKNTNNNNVIIFAFLMIISVYIFYSKMMQSYSRSFFHFHTIFSAPVIP